MRVSATKLYVFLFLIVLYGNFTLLLSLLNICSGKYAQKWFQHFYYQHSSLLLFREQIHTIVRLLLCEFTDGLKLLNNCIQYFKKSMGFLVLLSVICIN